MLEKFNSVALGVPAQQFHVRCHVSVERQVPVMTDFAVRLIHLVEKIEFDLFRSYFGLNGHEANELLEVLKSEGLVQDSDGVLSLTTYALSRFVASNDGTPRFTRIVERHSKPIFNLLTFSPLKKSNNNDYWDNTLDLKWEDSDNISGQTNDLASEAFHSHFHEIEIIDKDDENKRAYSVYKIEEISSGKRYNIPVPMDFYIDIEGNLEYRLEDNSLLPEDLKSRLTQLTADRVGKMVSLPDHFVDFFSFYDDPVLSRYMIEVTSSGTAKRKTMSLNPNSQKDFVFAKYIKEVHAEGGGEVYEAGKSQPILGALYMPKNLMKLLKSLEKAMQHFDSNKQPETPFPNEIFWIIPEGELWGRTELLKETVNAISKLIRKLWTTPVSFVAVYNVADSLPKNTLKDKVGILLQAGFHRVLFGPSPEKSERFELLVLPGVHATVLYQFKLPASDFHSVPIGFMSEHKKKLSKSHLYLRNVCLLKKESAYLENAQNGYDSWVKIEPVSGTEFLYLDSFIHAEG